MVNVHKNSAAKHYLERKYKPKKVSDCKMREIRRFSEMRRKCVNEPKMRDTWPSTSTYSWIRLCCMQEPSMAASREHVWITIALLYLVCLRENPQLCLEGKVHLIFLTTYSLTLSGSPEWTPFDINKVSGNLWQQNIFRSFFSSWDNIKQFSFSRMKSSIHNIFC